MPRLAESEKNQIIGLLNAGVRISTVARTFNVSRLTVYRLQQRFQPTGLTRDRPRPGRPRMTTQRQDGFIRSVHLRNRFQPAQRTADIINASTNNRQVSLNTVLRRPEGSKHTSTPACPTPLTSATPHPEQTLGGKCARQMATKAMADYHVLRRVQVRAGKA